MSRVVSERTASVLEETYVVSTLSSVAGRELCVMSGKLGAEWETCKGDTLGVVFIERGCSRVSQTRS